MTILEAAKILLEYTPDCKLELARKFIQEQN